MHTILSHTIPLHAISRLEIAGTYIFCFIAAFLYPDMQCDAQHDPLEESWRWVRFTTTSGLPSNSIRNVIDGPDATPWAVTTGGLAWYDGFQWHAVDSACRYMDNALCHVYGFFEKGLLLQIKENCYIATRAGMKPLPIDSVSYIWIDSEDTAFIVRKKSLLRYTHGNLSPVSLPWWNDEVLFVRALPSGRTFVHSRDRDFWWDGKARIPFTTDFIKGKFVMTFVVENSSRQGVVFLSSSPSHEGIWEWSDGGHAHRDAFRTVRLGLFRTIAENGDAVVVFENDFVRVRRNGTWKTVSLPNFVRDIMSVQFRLNGDLWIATQHGLFLCRLSLQRWTFHKWEESDLRNRVNNILRSRDGTLWLATSGGVVRIPRNGTLITYQTIAGKRIGIVTGLTEDRDGNVWISSGSAFTGAYRWDGKGWRYFPIQYRGEGVQIHRIACDSKGRLWFLGVAPGWDPRASGNPGVFTLKDGIIQRWRESDGLPHQRVYSFAEEGNGALWFGTFDGLARWKNGVWKVWKRFGGPVAGPVTSIAIDGLNRVWFGMQNQGTGLGILDSSNTISYVTTLDGLPDDFIWDIKIDARQKIWVSTQKGLACYDQNNWLAFDERTGLNEASIWPVWPEDSVVYIGNRSTGWAELRLSSAQAGNSRILIDRPVIEHGHVFLGWQAYTVWGSVAPEDALTRYRINDAGWSSWTATHSLSLDNIDPGDYTLQVQAKGLFGQYDETGQAISFTVPPPFVQRWYFYIPATVTGFLILGLSLLLYLRRRKYVFELGRSESRYRMITELMSDYAYLFQVREDASLNLIWMTDSFTRLTGFPAHEANDTDFMKRISIPMIWIKPGVIIEGCSKVKHWISSIESLQRQEKYCGSSAVPHRCMIRTGRGSSTFTES